MCWQVKDVAAHVTASNDDDGKFGLIRDPPPLSPPPPHHTPPAPPPPPLCSQLLSGVVRCFDMCISNFANHVIPHNWYPASLG